MVAAACLQQKVCFFAYLVMQVNVFSFLTTTINGCGSCALSNGQSINNNNNIMISSSSDQGPDTAEANIMV